MSAKSRIQFTDYRPTADCRVSIDRSIECQPPLAKWLLEFLGSPRIFLGIPRNFFLGIPRNFFLGIPRKKFLEFPTITTLVLKT